jgi:hypothetical protein
MTGKLVNQSTKYKNIQELKYSSKPADPPSTKSTERHDSFERSMRSLRQEYVKQLKQDK